MWQFGSAADASRGIGQWALGTTGLRRNTRSDCRRAATHSAPSFIAALPHCHIATFNGVLDTAPTQPQGSPSPH